MEHRWGYCEVCETNVVYCGKCGNNTCNGGYGTLDDGSECDACPSADDLAKEHYRKQAKGGR